MISSNKSEYRTRQLKRARVFDDGSNKMAATGGVNGERTKRGFAVVVNEIDK